MLLEDVKEEVKLSDNGDHDRFQHYFSKEDINKNLMFGTPMKALCGKVVEQQVDPKGRTVCQTCNEVLDSIFGKLT